MGGTVGGSAWYGACGAARLPREMLLIRNNETWPSSWRLKLQQQRCSRVSTDLLWPGAFLGAFLSFFLKDIFSGTHSGQSGALRAGFAWERFILGKRRTWGGRFQRFPWHIFHLGGQGRLVTTSYWHKAPTAGPYSYVGLGTSAWFRGELGRPELLALLPVQSLLAEKYQKNIYIYIFFYDFFNLFSRRN